MTIMARGLVRERCPPLVLSGQRPPRPRRDAGNIEGNGQGDSRRASFPPGPAAGSARPPREDCVRRSVRPGVPLREPRDRQVMFPDRLADRPGVPARAPRLQRLRGCRPSGWAHSSDLAHSFGEPSKTPKENMFRNGKTLPRKGFPQPFERKTNDTNNNGLRLAHRVGKPSETPEGKLVQERENLARKGFPQPFEEMTNNNLPPLLTGAENPPNPLKGNMFRMETLPKGLPPIIR